MASSCHLDLSAEDDGHIEMKALREDDPFGAWLPRSSLPEILDITDGCWVT